MTSAKKKSKAPAVAEGQIGLDFSAAGGDGTPEEERVDIGSGDEVLEDLMDE